MAMDYEENSSGDNPPAKYAPTQPYEDKRGLELPRIMVPPPNIDYDCGHASFHVVTEDFERADARFGNPQFLRAVVSNYQLNLEHTMLKWNYEGRREVQQVLPFLFIGPSTMARDAAFIQTTGITLILAVRSAQATSKHPRYLDPSRFPSATGIKVSTFDLDTPYELITNIRPVIKSINDHLETSCTHNPITSIEDIRGKVMIFCETGNERSAVVVAAYLMVVYGIGAITAIQVVQSQRFCINVDDGMKNMLLALEDIVNAERGVTATRATQQNEMLQLAQSGQPVPSLNKSAKRNIDSAYEVSDDMSDSADWTPIDGQRLGLAPFTDVGR